MTLTSPDGHTITLSSIWAQDKNGVIGSGTDMLWHVPADYQHFKATTLGSPIIMGRGSWEALGSALPGRTNIVMTSQPGYDAPGADIVPSLEAALNLACDVIDRQQGSPIADGVPGAPTETHPNDHQHPHAFTVWIVGGSTIYRQAMDLVDELVVSDLDLDVFNATPSVNVVCAPNIDLNIWTVDSSRSDEQWRQTSGDARWRVTTYVRRNQKN